MLEELATHAGVAVASRPATLQGLVSGAAAELLAGDGRVIGFLGRLAEPEPGPFPLYVAELDVSSLALAPVAEVELPPRLPGVAVDLTLTHPLSLEWQVLEAAIRRRAAPELVDFRLENRYRGEGVPEGAVNTTIHFLYNAGDRSLTKEEVNARQQALAQALAEELGLEL